VFITRMENIVNSLER